MSDFEQKKRQILDRVDILELASEHVTLKRSGRRWVGLCPFHTEKTPSFTVRPEHGMFKCFGCGKGGDIFSFVQFRENVTFGEALRILADRAGVELGDARRGEVSGPGRADLAKVNAWAVRFFRAQLLHDSVGRPARAYLHTRQISEATADQFSLGLATDGIGSLRQAAARAGFDSALLLAADLIRRSDRGDFYGTFRNRLMFPIRDATNRVVGFGGRTLADDPAKYLNTRQNILFDKGRGLYGIDLARDAIGKRGRAIVVEGYTDCLAAHQAGFTETVATLGTALTEAQVDLLRRYCDQIVLLFDSDRAGEAAADRAIHVALPRCVTVRLARIPDGKDPSEFLSRASGLEFSDLLNRAVEALEYKWLQTRERFRADVSNVQRREAILDFIRVVAEAAQTKAVDVIQRGLLVNQVAHLLQMNRNEVDRLMFRLQSRRVKRAVQPAGRIGEQPRPTPPDAEQAAWTHLLEVVLNTPDVLAAEDRLPDVRRIIDERDRRIATVVWELVERQGEFRLTDVLARCHEPGEVERVMELAQRGAQRGNFEKTFSVEIERIRRSLQNEETERSKERLLGPEEQDNSSDVGRDHLENIDKGAREHRGFSPRRLTRGTAGE